MYVLIIDDVRTGASREVALGATPLCIGSAQHAGVQVTGEGVEPDHCVIAPLPDGSYKLVDQHTPHGTRVNGGFVAQKRLEPGDRIDLGEVRIRYQVAAAPARAAGRSAPAAAVQRPAAAAAPAALPAPARPEPRPDPVAAGRRRAAEVPVVRRFARAALYTATAVMVSVVFLRFVSTIHGTDGAGPAYAEDRLALAGVLREGGRFEDARRVLDQLVTEDGAPAGVAEERRRLDGAEGRQRHARERLAGLLADTRTAPDSRLNQVRQLLEEYGDVPFVGVDIREAVARLEREQRQATAAGEPTPDERQELSAAFLRAGNFLAASHAWASLAESDLAVDRQLCAAAELEVDTAAQVAGERLLRRVDDMLARRDLMGALVALDESELAPFRAASVFPALEARAAQVDALVQGSPEFKEIELARLASQPRPRPPESPQAPPVEREPSAPPAGREPSTPPVEREPAAPPVEREPAAPPRPAPGGLAAGPAADALSSGDAAYARGQLSEAVKAYEAGLAAGPSGEAASQLTRSLERANRARWFLDAVRNRIEAEPAKVAKVRVRDAGGSVTGVVAGATADGVRVDTGSGAVYVLLEALAVDGVLALAKPYAFTPEEHLNRACYLMAHGLDKEVDAALLLALQDPALKQPMDSVIAFRRGMAEIPDWGFFRFDDRWLTFQEREQAENRIAVHAIAKRLDKAQDNDAAHAEAMEELKALLPVARADVVEVLRERRARMAAEIAAAPELKSLDRVFQQRRLLEERREAALKLIFDDVKYFYPYQPPDVPPDKAALYPKVQQEVDELVKGVREVWGDEFGEPPGGVSLSKRFRTLMARLDLEGALLRLGDPDGFAVEQQLEVLSLLPRGTDRVTLRNVALNAAERGRLDRDVEVLAYNAQVKTSAKEHEVEQVRITNMYRLMMGRGALAINDAICKAAWGHADWMSRTGIFGHFNTEDPKLRSPTDRMRAQGYASGSGENCAIAGSAMDAHLGWTHSSGHHRNLLYADHHEMGTGGVGRYWVQNFGGASPFAGNLGDDR